MAVLNTWLRWRRGEPLVLAALLFACLLLPAAAPGALLQPQQAQAVLLWLQSETAPAGAPRIAPSHDFRALSNRDNAPIYLSAAPAIAATAPDGLRVASLQNEARPLFIRSLEAHEAAFLTGVRNNRRRN